MFSTGRIPAPTADDLTKYRLKLSFIEKFNGIAIDRQLYRLKMTWRESETIVCVCLLLCFIPLTMDKFNAMQWIAVKLKSKWKNVTKSDDNVNEMQCCLHNCNHEIQSAGWPFLWSANSWKWKINGEWKKPKKKIVWKPKYHPFIWIALFYYLDCAKL